MRKPEKYKKVLAYFEANQPEVATELNYNNPFELLVAVILSAQCTDKRVNLVTPHLFASFPDVRALANASTEDVFHLIKSVSYPNNKSKHLVKMAIQLLQNFNGEVPESIDDLVTLAGVGRKTANVIASVVYHKPAMAVDTHVFRVSARIGLTTNAKNPLQAENQLITHIPKHLIAKAHHWLILHGRYICLARKPLCNQCNFTEFCGYFKKNLKRQSK